MLEHRRIPDADMFSFTHAGQPWVNWEWAHNILSALLWMHLGPAGIIFFRLLTAFLLCLVLFALFRRLSDGDLFLSFSSVLTVFLLVQQRVSDRPQFFAYLLIAAVVYLATTLQDIRSGRAAVLWGILVFLRNAHPSWVLAVLLVAVLVADRWLSRETHLTGKETALLLFGLVSVVFATPQPLVAGHYLSLQFGPHPLHEWSSIFSLGPLRYSQYYILFYLFSALMLWAVWESRRTRPFYALVTLLLLVNAYLHARFAADVALVGGVLAVPLIAERMPGTPVRPLLYALVFAVAMALGVRSMQQLNYHWGVGIDPDKVPLHAGEFIRDHDLAGNFFGIYSGSTDFLMAYAYPRVKVAVDIRVPGLYPYEFASRYWNVTNEKDLRDHVLSLPVDYIVLGRPDILSYQTHEIHVERILLSEGWALYHFDDRYALYGSPRIRDTVALMPFRIISRWNSDVREIGAAVAAGRFDELAGELERLKKYTAERGGFYREVLMTLYRQPFLGNEQKELLEEMF